MFDNQRRTEYQPYLFPALEKMDVFDNACAIAMVLVISLWVGVEKITLGRTLIEFPKSHNLIFFWGGGVWKLL